LVNRKWTDYNWGDMSSETEEKCRRKMKKTWDETFKNDPTRPKGLSLAFQKKKGLPRFVFQKKTNDGVRKTICSKSAGALTLAQFLGKIGRYI